MLTHRIEDIPWIRISGQARGICIGCTFDGYLTVIEVPGDPESHRKTFSYNHCPNCGTMSLISVPPDLSQYYGDDYYNFTTRRSSPIRGLARRARNAMTLFDSTPFARLSAKLSSNRQFLSLRPLFDGRAGRKFRRSDPILDVGCGQGQLLRELRDLGFTDLTGLDPFLRSPVSARGFALHRGEVETMEGAFRRATFQIVMFHHSLEHIVDPANTLVALREFLTPGGVVVVRIPLTGGMAWRTFGGEWIQLDAPRHVHLFSQKGFEEFARRLGWRVLRIVYDSGTFQFTGSRLRLMGIDFRKRPEDLISRFPRRERRQFLRTAERLNRELDGDQAAFFLSSSSLDPPPM